MGTRGPTFFVGPGISVEHLSKVVSTHLWNTPLNLYQQAMKGFLSLLARGIAWGVLYGCVVICLESKVHYISTSPSSPMAPHVRSSHPLRQVTALQNPRCCHGALST